MKYEFTRSFYKDASPLCTIRTIKAILKLVGIKTKIEEYQRSLDCYSCRLTLCNDNLYEYDIGANGKGMTRQLSQASAYAELMERLQNKTLFREGLRYVVERSKFSRGLRFQYFPDEVLKYTSANDLARILRTYFPRSHKGELRAANNAEKLIFVPFKILGSAVKRLLPIEIIRYNCSSTGMCAGNTREEALCQGIYEIFERYVLQRIFMSEESIPDIDLETFSNTNIYTVIQRESKENGLLFRVKDCSLGGRFPVLGLLIVDKVQGRYTFRLGADYNIITALERCYTESFQGHNADMFVFSRYIPEYKSTPNDYFKCRKNGTGHWPQYLLDQVCRKSRFPYIDFKSSEECLRHCVHILRGMGHKVFYRDNSFLGFPTYHVFIPGLSETDAKFENVELLLKQRALTANAIPLLQRMPSLSETEAKLLLADLKNCGKYINIFRWLSPGIGKKFTSLLRAGLAVRLKKFNDAYEALMVLISQLQESGVEVPLYYSALCASLYLKVMGNKGEMERRRAMEIYGKELFTEVEQDVSENKRSFLNAYPNCFNCESCGMANNCAFNQIVKLEAHLQSLQERRI